MGAFPNGPAVEQRTVPNFGADAGRASSGPSTHLFDMVEMGMKRGEEVVGELPHPPVIAAPHVGLEQVEGFDMGVGLGVDIGLVETAGVLGLESVEDRLVFGIELFGWRSEVGVADGLPELAPAAPWFSIMRLAKPFTRSDLVRSRASLLLSISTRLPAATKATNAAVEDPPAVWLLAESTANTAVGSSGAKRVMGYS
jgi:hypothetical protein